MQTLNGHNGGVLKVQWSTDSSYLLSNSASGEMIIWDCKTWKQFPKGPQVLKDEPWDKWTSLFGW